MATKPFRSSVGATIVQAWGADATGNILRLHGGYLALEIPGTVTASVYALTDGTAAASGTLALLPFGSAAAGVPSSHRLNFEPDGLQVDDAGLLGIKLVVGVAGTISGYFTGKQQRRT